MTKRWPSLCVLLFVVACAAGGKGTAVVAPTDRPLSAHANAPTGRADTAVETLFARLVKPKSANEGARAAAEAFAWAGMATHTLKGVSQEASPPIAPIVTPDFVTNRAAQDYAKGPGAPRVSLEKVGEWLEHLGWKPAKHPPAEALALLLSEWVKEATAHPQAPDSFVPLFLARSLKAGGGANVSQPGLPPNEITLTVLDLRLFLGAHLRGMQVRPMTKKKAAHFEAPRNTQLAKSYDGPTLGGGTALPAICSEFVAWMGATGIPVSGAVDVASSRAVGAIYSRLGIGSGAGSAIYWLLRGLDLVLSTQNNNLSFTLHGNPATTHKTAHGDRTREARFTARAQIMEFTSDVQRMARDCAEKIGFDIDTGGRDMPQWRVYWGEGDEFGESATIPDRNNFDYADPLGHNLHVHRVNQTTQVGTASLIIDIGEEEQHRPGSPLQSKKAWVRAELNQAVAPGLESLFGPTVSAAYGFSPMGVAGDLLFVAQGLYQEFTPEVARAYVTVESCAVERQAWKGTISYTRTVESTVHDPPSTNPRERTSGTSVTSSVETVSVSVDGSKARANFTSSSKLEAKTHRAFMQTCEFRKHYFQKEVQISVWAKETSSVSASANVEAGISVSPDGTYVVSFATPARLYGTHTIASSETQIGCEGSSTTAGPSVNDTKFPMGGFSDSATGTYSGSGGISGERNESAPYLGGTISVHMTWNFQPVSR